VRHGFTGAAAALGGLALKIQQIERVEE